MYRYADNMFLRIQDPAVLRRTLKLMKIMGTWCRMFMMRRLVNQSSW